MAISQYNQLTDPNVYDGRTYKHNPNDGDFYKSYTDNLLKLNKQFGHLPAEERWRKMNPQLVKQGVKGQWSGGPQKKATFDNPYPWA